MAINVPMPDLPGVALMKGIQTGGNLFQQIMNARYNSSLHPSGDVANAMYVEQLRNQYGEDDPRYLRAKQAHDMAIAGHQSLMDYRTQLSNLAPYRAATPEEKLIAAQKGQGVLQNYGGQTSGERVKPGMIYGEDGHVISEDEARVYNQALGKKTTDAAIRNKIPYAENVKITMDNIVPEDLVQYSGPQGHAKYAIDMIKAGTGSPPPEFMAYQKALTGAKTLSKQLRQFWGDSIQPAAMDKIEQLTNPSHWNKNPQVALQQFNQLKQITEQELQTFKDAGTSPLKLNYDKSSGNFIAEQKKKTGSSEQENMIIDDELIDNYLPDLMNINPQYTKENLKHTAKLRKIPMADLIDQLIARGK